MEKIYYLTRREAIALKRDYQREHDIFPDELHIPANTLGDSRHSYKGMIFGMEIVRENIKRPFCAVADPHKQMILDALKADEKIIKRA